MSYYIYNNVYLLNSDLTFVEVIHHYDANELENYDSVIDLKEYME